MPNIYNFLRSLFAQESRHAPRAVVDWVNEVRTEYLDLPPIEDLLPGELTKATSCPIANSLEVDVTVTKQKINIYDGKGSWRSVYVPWYVADFITLFDLGKYRRYEK